MRITSAPRSARIMQACGPGPIPASSTTFSPRSGPVPWPSCMPSIISGRAPWPVGVVRDETHVPAPLRDAFRHGLPRRRQYPRQESLRPFLPRAAEDLAGVATLEDAALVEEADRGGDVAGEGHLV